MLVLVVDDDPDVRSIVRRSLEREAFEVIEAGDAAEALRRTVDTPADMAVLDLDLPDMSGLELLAELRLRQPDIYVIMLTGAQTEADRVRGLASGADDYMVKPFSPRELAARVDAARRRHGRSSTTVLTRQAELPASAAAMTKDPTVIVIGQVVAYANPAAVALLGARDASELEGRQVLDFVAPQSLGTSLARQRSAGEGRWPRPEPISLVRFDGSEVLVEVGSLPVLWDGQAASQITMWDLTGDTSKLRELATGIRTDLAEAIIISDIQLRIQSFNPAAEELYGWSEDEVIGRTTLEVLPWERDDLTAELAREEFTARGRWHGEIVQRRRDGTSVTVRSSSTMLRDAAGEPVGIISVNRPIEPGTTRPSVARPEGDAALDDEIRRGINRGEFKVHYQPVVHLADGVWRGVEALVRWQHPVRGLLAPAAFIDAAERSGAIVDLGQLVLDEACRQWLIWHDTGVDLHMAVNLSGRQLADPNLANRLADTMASTSMIPGALWFEVTETSLVEDLDLATTVLRRIAELGASVSIDDFGTGWASLTYLREFPVHALKIDRVFVAGLDKGTTDSAIVSSIISLGAELGLSVIAEGIETADQLARLRQLGCQLGQGYFFARPQPPEKLDVAQHV
jgi:PAS domain S-box-containing protein